MKVFTVGLDQKPPLKDDPEKAEKAGSPPPGYSLAAAGAAVPLPMGPELPLPPTPLIMRKSRGYKGILLVMLTVFLIALFALTLSEITYNRQRDENFFRLRWAELKHRFGGYADYDYYFNRGPYAYAALKKQKELAESNFGGPLGFHQQRNDNPSTTTTTTTAEPVLAEVIDTSSSSGSRRPLGADLASSLASSSSSSSQQTSAEQSALLGNANGVPEITPADARLQFLRSILRRIKQHAEDMGFDGMMQVSVIEVEPQGEDQNGSKLNGPPPIIQQILPGLFSHLAQQQQQQQPRIEEPHAMNVKSDSFLDGFGEIHQPSFMQNNEIAEHNRGHLEMNDNRNNEHEEPMEFPIQWSRVNSPFRSDAFFPRPNWHLMAAQQQVQPQPQSFPPQFSQPRPFEWGGNSVVDDEFMARRFGGPPPLPQQPQIQPPEPQPQAPQPQLPPPMIQVFPQSAPLFFPPQQQQQPSAPQPFGHFPAGQIMGVSAGAGPEFRSFKMVGPPPPPPTFEEPQQPQQMESSAAGQEIGEMNGGRIGQFVKELIANRLQALNQLQQQQQPNQMTFVPPENRIQIEPPTPTQQQQQQMVKSDENNNKPKSMIVDSDDNSANLNAGWTHQPKLAGGESEDGLESVRNFAKMMAAGVAEEAARRRAEVLAGSIPMAPSSFFARPRAVAAAPLIIDSSSAAWAAAEEPTSRSGEQEQRKSPALMPVLSIDPPMVDIPTVRFPPTNNKDRDGLSTSSKTVTVDEDKPAASGERSDEPSAEKANTKGDKSAPPALPQMNDAESAHANGVFFQVDDPAAAFGVGQAD